MTINSEKQAPDACTLPTEKRPARAAEFDDLFATALRRQQRLSPTRLRWWLDPAAEATARDLTGRETACCSFFTFTFTPGDDGLNVDITVPEAHADILDAFVDRAGVRMRP